MKRLIVILLIGMMTVLSACQEDPVDDPVPTDEECTENQVEVDGTCYTLTGPEIQLRAVLQSMQTTSNYAITVSITDPMETETLIELAYDENISMFEDQQTTIYTKQLDTTCQTTTIEFNTISVESEDCSDDSVLFYETFTYDMFHLESGVFHLKDSYIDEVSEQLDPLLSIMELTSLSLSISSDTITSIHLELLHNEDLYTMDYTFHDYGTVDLVIPEEGNDQ